MLWFGYLLGCIVAGAVCVAIMNGKGHTNNTGWFFCGFFLGIIGIIIAACQTNLNYINAQQRTNYSGNSNQYSDGYSSRGTVVCKSCGATNSSSTFHCQSCGAKLSPAVSAQSTDKEGSWKCLCGAKNFAYEKTCHRCGASKQDVLNSGKSPNSIDNYWTCGCGTMNFITRNFCRKCGQPNPKPLTDPTTKSEEKPLPKQPNIEQNSSSASLADQLKEFKSLLDQGLITEADFEAKKKQILGI